ncbi:MAG: DUF488 domain-containing protein [Proteobacteria bacterium]|nr:DUF488 domain-containing protein [Pseudomonadota bacterium]
MAKLQIKRVYDASNAHDGQRVLVDRIWPRGVSKDDLKDVLWLKDLAPSTELRQWFGHKPERWTEFTKRYRAELDEAGEPLSALRALMKKGRVTLLYSARDTEHNQAVVLRDYLEKR